MKAKTVWKHVDDIRHFKDENYWYDSNGIWFAYNADVRWANCFGRCILDVELESWDLEKSSKILGDE